MSITHVLYIDTASNWLIDSALLRAANRGEIIYKSYLISDLTKEKNIIDSLKPDIILAPADIPEISGKIPLDSILFDIDNILNDYLPNHFVLSEDQNILGLDDSGGIITNVPHKRYGNIGDALDDLNDIFDRLGSGSPGAGRVGAGVFGRVLNFFLFRYKGIVQEVVDAVTEKEGNDQGGDSNVERNDNNGNGKKENDGKDDKDKKKDKGFFIDDVQGFDFLILLNEILSTIALNDLYQSMLEGRRTPENSASIEEFQAWLNEIGVDGILQNDRPLQDEDDTIFAFMLWAWGKADQAQSRKFEAWQYLWKKGAPIDPVELKLNDAQVSYIGGTYNHNEEKLELKFLSF